MGAIAGIGLGLRAEFIAEIPTTTRRVDFLEVIPENWLAPHQQPRLAPVMERWPLIPHGISLSIGGPDPIDRAYLSAIRELSELVDAEFFSDHVCYSSVGGIQTGELLPLPFSPEALEHTLARIAEVRRQLERPLVLENPTYYCVMPGSTMDEPTFLCTLLAESGCGMLLDVNNVYVNAKNHGYDPHAFIDRMPLDRVAQIHMAGHRHDPKLDTIVDTHGAAVIDPVWDLYRYTIARAKRLIPTVIEWDFNVPPLEALLDEVDRARAHAERALSDQQLGSAGRTA